MNIFAFAASNSKKSINKQLVTYATSLLADAKVEIADLNDYELPMFSTDLEAEIGQPTKAQAFLNKIAAADALVISFAEHNGNYSAVYKNLFDWCSRINNKLFQDKPMILLATSPGARGGANVLNIAVNSAPFFAGNVLASVSVPSFYENFDTKTQTLVNEELREQVISAMKTLGE